MDNHNYYVASCWTIEDTSNATQQEQPQLAISLFDVVMRLDEGLERMAQDGWKLIHVQNNTLRSNAKVLRTGTIPVRFYLFSKDTG